MDYFFAGIALLFCLYGSYTDLQSGRIPNVCSFGLIYAGVIAQLLFVIKGSTSVTAAGTTIFVGGVLFFVLYWFGFWAAGDTKLCWGVSMMLPLSFFQDTKMGINFPPPVLLINISIIYFSFAVIYLLVKSSINQKKIALDSFLTVENLKKGVAILITIATFIVFASVLSYIMENWLPIQLPQFVLIIFLLFLFFQLRKLKGQEMYLNVAILIPSILFIYLYVSGPILPFFKNTATIASIFTGVALIRELVFALDGVTLSRHVNIDELQQGMIPAERIVRVEDNSEVQYETDQNYISSHLDKDVFLSPTPEGLSEDKIIELKKLATEGHFNHFDNRLMIQHTFHFAPMILLGTLLTIISKGPFYSLF